jgi:hypothetical protein
MKTKLEDDWSVSSSESNFVPGFTVTVNFSGLQSETFNLDAYNSESAGMESLLSEPFLAHQEVNAFDVERDLEPLFSAITSLKKNVAGSVCLCDF